jgi:hypothetical protein
MSSASKIDIIEQAKYINTLAQKILQSATMLDEKACQDRASGTIKNLAPELSKEASKINKMCRWGWK